MRIFLGADHAGFELKEHVRRWLMASGYEVTDVGTDGEASVDYPDFARLVAEAVGRRDADFGVLVCGTGLGMAIAANKVPGVRAVPVSDPEIARMSRLHNDANVIALPGRHIAPETAEAVLQAFLTTDFEGGRHQRRLDKIRELEESER
ncbi:MAG: ribose 5-phosphate isomerase B [Actinobacteria bacterium]|nr:ribose 5-phosphate isomerase B [Actinomycetota bacterium]